MPQGFGGAGSAGGHFPHPFEYVLADLLHAGFAFDDGAGVDVHVVRHAPVSVRIGAHLDDRRNGRTHHGAAPGGEQYQMRSAGDQFDDFRIVRDVGEAEARFAVRHDVQQVQPSLGRQVARLNEAADGRIPGFGVGAHGLLLLGGQAALGVARREAAEAQCLVISSRLFHHCVNLLRQLRRRRSLRHDLLAADQLPGFLEDAGGASGDQAVEAVAHCRVGGNAAGAVGAAADGAHHQFVQGHIDSPLLGHLGTDAGGCRQAGRQGLLSAAALLYHQGLHRAPAVPDGGLQFLPVEAFATQGQQHHAADVGMGAEPFHHAQGVGVGVAAGKADQLRFGLRRLVDDQPRHMMGALHQVGHQ